MVPEEGLARLGLCPTMAAAFAAGLKADACLWTKCTRYPASASNSGGAPVRRALLPDRSSVKGTPAVKVSVSRGRGSLTARRPSPVQLPPVVHHATRKDVVPEEGLEPSRPRGHGILSPARLPVPPLRRRPGRSAPDIIYTPLSAPIPTLRQTSPKNVPKGKDSSPPRR